MRHWAAAASACALTLLGHVAFAQGIGGVIECEDGPTYYPRGDRWVVADASSDGTADPISYRQSAGNNGVIGDGSVPEAIDAAFGAWSDAVCPGGEAPGIALARASSDFSGANGGGEEQSIVYFEDDPAEFSGTRLTLAMTTNLFVRASGYTVSSDMELNAFEYDWRTELDGSRSGCDPQAQRGRCYDVEAVVLHEVGHFLGFDHVLCDGAVMYPEGADVGAPKALTEHEIAGICSLYPPRPAPSMTPPHLGDRCEGDSECGDAMVCAQVASNSPGYCTAPCSTDDDCSEAYVCASVGGRDVCKPGLKQDETGTPTTEPGLSDDLCGVCLDGSDCGNGLCILENTGDDEGFCTVTCADKADCPDGMRCQTLQGGGSVCWPERGCDSVDGDNRPGLNELCYDSGNGEEDDYMQPCGPGLICFGFRSRCAGARQTGACVAYCNPDQNCPDANQTCCYGVDAQGNCLTQPPQEGAHGGCFNLRKEGQTCVLAEESVCETGASCFHFGDSPEGAKCYRLCDGSGGFCGDAQTCLEFTEACSEQRFGLCCNDDSGQVCEPAPPTDIRGAGVRCRLNSECETGLCLKLDGESACTRRCNVAVDNFGCPPDAADVNGDGQPDGGFTCRVINGEGFCWPKAGPLDPNIPETDGRTDAADPPATSGCCSATTNQGRSQSLGWATVFLCLPVVSGWWWRRLRLKRSHAWR